MLFPQLFHPNVFKNLLFWKTSENTTKNDIRKFSVFMTHLQFQLSASSDSFKPYPFSSVTLTLTPANIISANTHHQKFHSQKVLCWLKLILSCLKFINCLTYCHGLIYDMVKFINCLTYDMVQCGTLESNYGP